LVVANYCKSAHIVCEFEDHSSNGGYWEDGNGTFYGQNIPPTGNLLNNYVLPFWTAMATQFKDNPYAWIGSLNELGVASYDTTDIAAMSTYQLAL
jgi:hypothetical protein